MVQRGSVKSMPAPREEGRLRWRGLVGLAGLFAALCTIFALVVTIAEAWQEHAQAHWPQITAHLQRCDVELYQSDERSGYYVDCRIGYLVGAEEIAAKIRSGLTPAPGGLA
jgi:hypothetical protein